MKSHFIRCLSFALIWLAASSAAQAGIHVNVDLNPFVWGPPPPPVVYEPPRYYAPPPVVYYGHGYWGDRDWRRHDHDWRRHDDWRERHDRGGRDRR